MSTATQQLTLDEAMFAAAKFQALFDPAIYERWTVAGSVRRQRPEVGDIEHVVIPRFGDRPSSDLFATPTRVNLVLARMDELVIGGTIARHVYPNGTVRWGERYRGCYPPVCCRRSVRVTIAALSESGAPNRPWSGTARRGCRFSPPAPRHF